MSEDQTETTSEELLAAKQLLVDEGYCLLSLTEPDSFKFLDQVTFTKFKLVSVATQRPGQCIVCKRVDGPFIDVKTEVGLDALYFCMSCLRAMFNLVEDMYLPTIQKVFDDATEALSEKYNAEIKEFFDGLAGDFASRSATIGPVTVKFDSSLLTSASEGTDEGVNDGSSKDSGSKPGTNPAANSAERKTAKQSTKSDSK